jgi:hypothetical protein
MDLGQILRWNDSTGTISFEHQQFHWNMAPLEDTSTSKWNDSIWNYREWIPVVPLGQGFSGSHLHFH